MGWRTTVGCAVALHAASCAQVFGLDPTTRDDNGNVPGHATFAVQGVYFGATTIAQPIAFTDTRLLAYEVDSEGFHPLTIVIDGDQARVELAPGFEGLWELMLPAPFDSAPRYFPITNRTREWRVVVSHDGGNVSAPPPPGASLDVAVDLAEPHVVGDAYALLVAGPWGQHTFSPPPIAGAASFDPPPVPYGQLQSVVRKSVPTLTADDWIYVTRHRGQRLVGGLRVPGSPLTANPLAISGSVQGVATGEPLRASTDAMEASERLSAVSAGIISHRWQLNAVPDSPYHSTIGLQLDAAELSPAQGTINTTVSNPFAPTLTPSLVWFAQATRPETDGNNQVWPHVTGFTLIDRRPQTDNQFLADVALPTSLSLNGTRLAADMRVVRMSRDRPMEWVITADRTGADRRDLDCYRFDLAPQRFTLVFHARAVTDRVRLPAGLLSPGQRYMCRTSIHAGFPAGDRGDDTNRADRVAVGYHDSGSFLVD